MKKLFQFALIILAVAMVGCQDDIQLDTTTIGAKNMSELKVSPDFDWSTSKIVEISITGLPALTDIAAVKSTLSLKGQDKIFYSGFHSINENLKFNMVVPSTETKIQLKFGAIEQESSIENNKVSFSFIPTITD
ncbi:MAG: hypothetical protein ACOYMD_01425 [Paludibacter sp.]